MTSRLINVASLSSYIVTTWNDTAVGSNIPQIMFDGRIGFYVPTIGGAEVYPAYYKGRL